MIGGLCELKDKMKICSQLSTHGGKIERDKQVVNILN